MSDRDWIECFPLWDEGFTVNVDTERKANCVKCGAVVCHNHWEVHVKWHRRLERHEHDH